MAFWPDFPQINYFFCSDCPLVKFLALFFTEKHRYLSRILSLLDRKTPVYTITEEEFEEPIRDNYVQSISQLSYAELDDKYNPGIQVGVSSSHLTP
ncbi:unnamed protein product [Gongylonema pulchrum]|uniref:Uncharacterized protein n=1 Tax=Gongylonema pulchrum TaxID=637853 RepID=A0A183ET74_9BILA|nr:unnamed protein product [Gongylonema pulchrum]